MKSVSWRSFLKDAFICSLGSYGGPEAHISVFIDQLVTKKKYLSEEELIELVALCSILPGPTSTQTLVAVGHKMGGAMAGTSNHAGLVIASFNCNDHPLVRLSNI